MANGNGQPVVVVAANGQPVVQVTLGTAGEPMLVVTGNQGVPVTLVASLGRPVSLVNTDGTAYVA